jgi:shikimate dehydrogenase
MTDRYAVLGNPVAHSKSPEIHAAFARQTSQELSYERILVPLDQFRQVLLDWRDAGARGANVTLPFKFEALAIVSDMTARARRAGAVNAIKFEGDSVLGDNTDGVGLCRDIIENLRQPIIGRRVLLLGAGGAAHGVAGALLDAAPAQLAIANRTMAKAEAIARHLLAATSQANLQVVDLQAPVDAPFDLIINATSASLNDSLPLLPGSCFAEHCLAYDMMYGKDQTPFLAMAADHGARTSDGLGMLVEQAAESFSWWRGVLPATAPVLANLRLTSGPGH